MTKTTKIVLVSASVLLTGSVLLMIYSRQKQIDKYNAAVNTPQEALSIIGQVNASNGIQIAVPDVPAIPPVQVDAETGQ